MSARSVHSLELPKLSVEKLLLLLLLLLVLTLPLLLPVAIVFVAHSCVVHCQQLRRLDSPFRLSFGHTKLSLSHSIRFDQPNFLRKRNESSWGERRLDQPLDYCAASPAFRLTNYLQLCNAVTCKVAIFRHLHSTPRSAPLCPPTQLLAGGIAACRGG